MKAAGAAVEGPDDLDALAAHLRSHAALRAKGEIGLVSEVLGAGDWVHGPGDDGAVLRIGSRSGRRPHRACRRLRRGPAARV